MPLRRSRFTHRRLHALAALALLLVASPALRAETSPADRVAAESLFAEGRQLLAAGDYAQACHKLEASRRLEPALGTSLNLADCYARLGRTASAWAEFKSAAAEAQKADDPLRKTEALERARALEPRLSRVRVELDDPAARVLWNGVPLSSSFIGNAIPVDPGNHRFEATAPGKLPWSQSVEVGASAPLVEVRVPVLSDAPPVPAPVRPAPAEPPPMTSPSGGRHEVLAWSLAGAGAVALGTGAVLGALAASSWSKAEGSCIDYPYGCSRQGLEHEDTARARASGATVALLLGTAAVATSVVLFVIDGDEPESAEVAVSPAGVELRGAF